ncbi:MAG: carbohydrate ABC transporter permease [candidate division NC10 bacterium]|nr:carbohydrate ABC transporter permease [candidate division NC10 bacterium]MBI2454775.1 carbohydrate ABC transporter permease [candidate division NC10 bacterium]
MNLRRISYTGSLYLGSAALVILCGVPLLWMLFTSLKPPQDLFAYPPRIFGRYTLANFHRLISETDFVTYLKNSIVVAGVTVLLDIVVATLGAYSLTRYRYRGKELLANMTLFTYMFAPIMIIVPIYVLLKELNLTNSHLGMILAYTSISLPFTLWLLRAFFQSFPVDLEQAAFIDGANRFQSLIYVVIPQALPGIIATSVFAFVVVWNDYLFARILLNDPMLQTMPVGLQDIYESTIVDWGLLMSGAVIVTIPAVIFFLIVQRYLIQGWGMGAVKG